MTHLSSLRATLAAAVAVAAATNITSTTVFEAATACGSRRSRLFVNPRMQPRSFPTTPTKNTFDCKMASATRHPCHPAHGLLLPYQAPYLPIGPQGSQTRGYHIQIVDLMLATSPPCFAAWFPAT